MDNITFLYKVDCIDYALLKRKITTLNKYEYICAHHQTKEKDGSYTWAHGHYFENKSDATKYLQGKMRLYILSIKDEIDDITNL